MLGSIVGIQVKKKELSKKQIEISQRDFFLMAYLKIVCLPKNLSVGKL